MGKKLVIVESPAKAKTIEKILGKDWKVTSSYGHVRDLESKNISIDVDNNYEPNYVISDDKKKVVTELKKLAKDAEEIYLATDEDREGEAISWHLCSVLGLDPLTAKRISYKEITPKALQEAVAHPRTINLNLVNAQQARRIIDRLVGYSISPILWRKVKPSLSAGRVQSVTVRLIVEREREIMSFNTSSFFKLQSLYNVEGAELKAEYPKKLESEEEASSFLESCKGADHTIEDIQKKPGTKSPSNPFTTSTLQQEASRKLGYSVAQTMMFAQKLYEAGHITYMRTDSVTLSNDALQMAKETIVDSFGPDYHQERKYQTKSSSAQEAHEAIRPTKMSAKEPDVSRDQARLYDLIWKRTLASQMANAKTEKTNVHIKLSSNNEIFLASGEVLIFDGFLKVYQEGTDEENEEKVESGLLPPLKVGQVLDLDVITATERFTRPPARFTEASLVKKLEELGIGRPSTYAPTISTVIRRTYVVKEAREGVERRYKQLKLEKDQLENKELTEITGAEKNKLFPTDIGKLVNDFLVENFENILDYQFTAKIEQEFDAIANGGREWEKLIDEFYKPFNKVVEHTLEHSKRVNGERLLGQDPETGENLYVKMGRYGAMAQIGETSDEKKPKFAKLRHGQTLETISYDEALELFKLPRKLEEYEGDTVTVAIGRFGPYVLNNKKFASIPKEEDPYTITRERCIELIEIKKEADRKKFINEFEVGEDLIQILNGRWGPYIKKGKKNFKIPKDQTAEELTLEDCLKIIEEAPAKKTSKK